VSLWIHPELLPATPPPFSQAYFDAIPFDLIGIDWVSIDAEIR
jgi:hypothetical protein